MTNTSCPVVCMIQDWGRKRSMTKESEGAALQQPQSGLSGETPDALHRQGKPLPSSFITHLPVLELSSLAIAVCFPYVKISSVKEI